APLIPASDPWGVWAAVTAAGAFGIWAEKNTSWGKSLSGALVATIAGLALSNAGVIPFEAPAYAVINKYLLPLAVPLLLFAADLKRVIRDTGKLLIAFVIGAIGTAVGTVVAFHVFPQPELGADGWKVAAALCARHIGGAVNYVSVAGALKMSPIALTAGLAADNLVCAIYFSTLYWLARNIPAEGGGAGAAGAGDDSEIKGSFDPLRGGQAIAVAALLCYAGTAICTKLGWAGMSIPVVTAIAVALATLFPSKLAPLVASGEALAAILMQYFFVAIGAAGSVKSVVATAPMLFAFCVLQIVIHLATILGAGKLLGFETKGLLISSNACVGGPTTAAGMAASKSWGSLVVPGLLVGTLGYASATFLSIALGKLVLQGM
ncbi:unnamed protein product, partial [Pedinophyceae sp. YPF-701]